MTHLRAQLFDAVKAIVAAIPEFSGAGKVARGRDGPVRQESLPAITLTWFDDDERAEARPGSGLANQLGYTRDLRISIIVHLRDASAETEFDRIAELVETAMAGDVTLGGKAIEALLASSRLFVDQTTGVPLGAGRLVYAVSYKALAAAPGTPAL